MVEIRVRAPVPDDGPAIARAHVRAWQEGYAGLMPQAFLDGLDEEERGRAWEQRLIAHRRTTAGPGRTEGPEFLVAELTGEVDGVDGVVGVATIGPEREPGPGRQSGGEVWMVNVHPDAWGRGVGSALLAAAVAALADRGHRSPVLWVLEGNARARAFYERNGWTFDGATKSDDFGGAPLCELRYRHPGR